MPTSNDFYAQNDAFALNQDWLDKILSRDAALEKLGSEAINGFVRTYVREGGLMRRAIPLVTVTNADLTPDIDARPSIVCEIEASSPGAISVPFNATPVTWYVRAPRFRVTFNVVNGPRFVTDINELRTWRQDIREVVSDNAVKDILAQEDSRFISALNTAMGGVADAINPMTGYMQWQTIYGGITRDTVVAAKQVMPTSTTRVTPQIGITNVVTSNEFVRWDGIEATMSVSQDMLLSGMMQEKMFGLDWIITNKRHLVPDNTMFFLADPRFIGKFFALEDITLEIKREATRLEWYPYEVIGFGIPRADGITRADFATT